MDYTTRPISDRTWLKPQRRKGSAFTATWNSTLELLEREIKMLGGRNVVIEVDVREGDLRIDGQLKARAKAAGPAVRVAFDSREHGPMLFQCDRYSGGPWGNKMEPWQHNVRAIALTMEALRAADRHEAIDSGQQYQGFKAIGGGSSGIPMGAPQMTRVEAHGVILKNLGGQDKTDMATDWKRARRNAHPDLNAGDHTRWRELEEAGKVLGLL